MFLNALVSKNRFSYSRGRYSYPHSCTHTLFSLLLQIASGVYELTRRPGRLFPSFSISLFIPFFFFFAALQGMQDLHFPTGGWTPCPKQWKLTVLTAGPPGKPLLIHSFFVLSLLFVFHLPLPLLPPYFYSFHKHFRTTAGTSRGYRGR